MTAPIVEDCAIHPSFYAFVSPGTKKISKHFSSDKRAIYIKRDKISLEIKNQNRKNIKTPDAKASGRFPFENVFVGILALFHYNSKIVFRPNDLGNVPK